MDVECGGLPYQEAGRDDEAMRWLTAALRLELERDDAERIVDELSDARRVALERLGSERDGLEREVDEFASFAPSARRRRSLRFVPARRAGLPVRGRVVNAAWLAEVDHEAARELVEWPARGRLVRAACRADGAPLAGAPG